MSHRAVRVALVTLDAFTALTAVAGGVLLATGREAERFPVEALRRTPFANYVAPGCLLGSLVGGSAAVATAATLRDPRLGGSASMAAGSVLLAWVAVEELVLDLPARTTTDTVTDGVYLATGAAMFALGRMLRRGAISHGGTARAGRTHRSS